MGFIYKITNTINNKNYIGQTINSVEYRFNQHFREAKSEKLLQKTTSYFHNALNKYDKNQFKYEVLEEVDNFQLSDREKYWIRILDATNREIGYNIGEGGETAVRSSIVRAKIGLKTKERWDNNPEAAARMRAGLVKATKAWQEQAKANRTIKHCLFCNKSFEVANWNHNKKYCSIECKQLDTKNWLNYQKGLDAATAKNKANGIERAAAIKKLVLKWALENSEYILRIPYNKITPSLQPILNEISETIGVSDARTIAKAVCGELSRKALLDYLKNYVKMYAVPDQK